MEVQRPRKSLKTAPRCSQNAPRSRQDGPREPQDGAKIARVNPKMAQDGSKVSTRWPQGGPEKRRDELRHVTSPRRPPGLQLTNSFYINCARAEQTSQDSRSWRDNNQIAKTLKTIKRKLMFLRAQRLRKGPKRPQDGPKMAPRWPKERPRGLKMKTRWRKRGQDRRS